MLTRYACPRCERTSPSSAAAPGRSRPTCRPSSGTRTPRSWRSSTLDQAARERAAHRFGVAAAYASHEELFAAEQPDGVIIATPHARHFEQARAALEAGAHVLVEKPMVLEPEHGRELQRLARERGRELIVGYPWHYNQQAVELGALFATGELGTVEFASSLFLSMVREYYRGDPGAYQPELQLVQVPRNETSPTPALSGGGQGQAQLTHSAALLFWLTGLRPRRWPRSARTSSSRSTWSTRPPSGSTAARSGRSPRRATGPPGTRSVLDLHFGGTTGGALRRDGRAGRSMCRPGGRRDELEPLPARPALSPLGPGGQPRRLVLGRAETGRRRRSGA